MERTDLNRAEQEFRSRPTTPGWISLHDHCVRILEMFVPMDDNLDSVLKEQHRFGDILIENVVSDSIVRFIRDKRREAVAIEIDIIRQLEFA